MLELDKKYFHPDGNFNFNEDFRWLDENIYLKEFSLLLGEKFPLLIWKKDYFDANPSYRRLSSNYKFTERMMRYGLVLADNNAKNFFNIAVIVEDVCDRHDRNSVTEILTYYIQSKLITRESSSYPNEVFPCDFIVGNKLPELIGKFEKIPYFASDPS